MSPNYDIEKIKFATDEATFKRAIGLYETGRIKDFQENFRGFSATVMGTSPYRVLVSKEKYNFGECNCYVGQKEILCKHIVTVAVYAVKDGKPLSEDDKTLHNQTECSGKMGELSKKELTETNKAITRAMRYIKSYEGPSSTWVAYQDSLTEGCNRLSSIVSRLLVSRQSAKILVKTLLKLDRKLSRGGVDDSDGIVGGFIWQTVSVLEEYAMIDPRCIKAFKILKDQSTCFGWEDSLVEIYNKNN